MSTLEQIPGAGLLVDESHTITDGNNRCQVVFNVDVERLLGKPLDGLRERGLLDGETLGTWKSAVTTVQQGERAEVTEQITLTPTERDDEFSYALRVQEIDRESVCCTLRSIGTGRRYDETLTALHAATRDLMTADTREAVLERTAEAANGVLGFPGTAVRSYDPAADVLRMVSMGARVTNIDDRPPYPVDDSPHGTAFRRGETVIDDISEDDPYDREVFTQTMYIPIGDTALLSLGTVGEPFDETDVQFGEILAENASAALTAIETTASLRQERERLDLLKQILTRVLRHNIRNAANIIRGNTQMLVENAEAEPEREAAHRVLQCTDDIIQLSEKARQIERIIDGDRAPVPIDLSSLVDRVVSHTATEYPDATVETDLADCHIRAHEAVDLAVENLIENACEHTSGEPTVHVETAVAEDTVQLTVSDDGSGIQPGEVDAIEAEGETDLSHGSGLGLWIVKLVVEMSDGDLEFDASPAGTRVTLTLERAEVRSE